MPKYDSTLEQAVLESLVPALEAEGFEVFIHPDRKLLPPFMGAYRPDAIAFKAGKCIAIEVMSQALAGDTKTRNLEALFGPQKDWELRVIFSPPRGGEASSPVERMSANNIQEMLDATVSIGDHGRGIPSLLTLWGAFEAAGRRLIPKEFYKPQTPGRLLEVLASDGYVTPKEADEIRGLVALRNSAIHGNFSVEATSSQLAAFRSVIETLLKEEDAASLQ